MMLVAVYVVTALLAFLVTVVLVHRLCRARLRPVVTLVVVWAPYVGLGMVRIRCILSPPIPCGDILAVGLTWHILPAIAIVALAALGVHRLGMTADVKPLAGAWLGLVWYAIPISIIHPVAEGETCPNLPIICHDLTLAGHGGLFYWLLPFVLWTLARMVAHYRLRGVPGPPASPRSGAARPGAGR